MKKYLSLKALTGKCVYKIKSTISFCDLKLLPWAWTWHSEKCHLHRIHKSEKKKKKLNSANYNSDSGRGGGMFVDYTVTQQCLQTSFYQQNEPASCYWSMWHADSLLASLRPDLHNKHPWWNKINYCVSLEIRFCKGHLSY